MLNRRSPGYSALREELVRRRKESGRTQRELALELGVTPSLIARVETGERRLDVVELVRYCEALGAPPPAVLRAVMRALGKRPARY